MTLRLLASATVLIWTLGCVPAAGLKRSPPTWTTESGYPEVTLDGVQPREVTGAINAQLSLKDFEMVSADDYSAKFRAKSQVSLGIRWLPEFTYLSLPGKIRVVAKAKVESMGTPLDADKDEEITHFCHTVLQQVAAGLKK